MLQQDVQQPSESGHGRSHRQPCPEEVQGTLQPRVQPQHLLARALAVAGVVDDVSGHPALLVQRQLRGDACFGLSLGQPAPLPQACQLGLRVAAGQRAALRGAGRAGVVSRCLRRTRHLPVNQDGVLHELGQSLGLEEQRDVEDHIAVACRNDNTPKRNSVTQIHNSLPRALQLLQQHSAAPRVQLLREPSSLSDRGNGFIPSFCRGEKKKINNQNPNLDDLRPKVKLQKYNEEMKQEAQMEAAVRCWQEQQSHVVAGLSRGAVPTAECALLSFSCPRLCQAAVS